MRNINTCKNCPDHKRIVTEDHIYDCHSDCPIYKEAFDRETDTMNKAIKARQADKQHLEYLIQDKEKRRRMHYPCKK